MSTGYARARKDRVLEKTARISSNEPRAAYSAHTSDKNNEALDLQDHAYGA